MTVHVRLLIVGAKSGEDLCVIRRHPDIKLLRRELDPSVALIGFSGALRR